jgi:hypothetical protein
MKGSSMGYYSSLIKRKFQDVVGTRYEGVMQEYKQFLPTEEEMRIPEVHSILVPLDYFVKGIAPGLPEILSVYEAPVSIIYIIDADVSEIIEKTLGKETSERFIKAKEDYGHALLETVSLALEEAGVKTQQRIFTGNKTEVLEKIGGDYDLIAISKTFGAEPTKQYPVSPLTLRISQHQNKVTIIY